MTNDPDLDQACEDLVFDAIRLRQLQAQSARLDPVKHYSTLTARKVDLADAEEAFRVRGERLCMHPDRRLAGRALLLVVEHADRLKTRLKRRPTGVQLTDAVRLAADAAEKARVEAEADLVFAQMEAATAQRHAGATTAALAYIEASR